ncbi:MAG: hypothetical protein ABIS38_02905 [Sphingomicrobium sp.]
MIALNNLNIEATCPICAALLRATGWYMPGMRILARAQCAGCRRDFFVDLPAGQGLHSPMILDRATGAVHDRVGVAWFADWLRISFRERTGTTTALTIDRRLPITRTAVLINCLDTLYGHALLKLFSVQQYLDAGEFDVILIVQPFLASLVPKGVAETWLVDLPLPDGIRWSDSLAEAIATQSARIEDLRLAPVHPHPHASIVSIERFSSVPPFATNQWHAEGTKKVTFIWRDDRIWSPAGWLAPRGQVKAVAAFFVALRREQPHLDAAVAGLGTSGGLPDWIADKRFARPSENVERDWLRLYADSHAVIGVHGSNMILPSAHAGSVFELLPDSRQGNFLQDILFNGTDPRDLLFRYRFVPDDIAPARLARLVAFVLARYPDFDRLMSFDAGHDRDVRA